MGIFPKDRGENKQLFELTTTQLMNHQLTNNDQQGSS